MSVRAELKRVVDGRYQAGNRAARKHMAYDAVLRHLRSKLTAEDQVLVDRVIDYSGNDHTRPAWILDLETEVE